MKNIILIITLFLGTVSLAVAQEQKEILVSGMYDGNVVKLRWSPSDYTTWRKLNDCGVTISRITIKSNGQSYNSQQKEDSKVILASGLKPLSESEFQNQFPSDDPAKVVCGSLYSTEYDVPPNDPPKLVDALNHFNREEAKFVFTVMAVEQNYDVALAAAMGYEDNTYASNDVYIYTVEPSVIDSVDVIKRGFTQVNTISTFDFPSVEGIHTVSTDKGIEINWKNPSECKYTSFDIERSVNGSNYSKINDQPFVFMTTEKNVEFITYVDKTVEPGITYSYKVVGNTPFNTQSLLSEEVSDAALFTKLIPGFLKIEEPVVDGGSIDLIWSLLPTYEDSILGYNIYRKENFELGFQKINTTMLPKSALQYTDSNPFASNYYQIESIDIYGNTYKSIGFLAQLPDTDPPAAPTGVIAKYSSSSDVMITWDQNTEDDMDGYKVYASNQRDGTYVQLHNRVVKGNYYTHSTDPSVIGDSLYIKIIAQDDRENYSEYSAVHSVKRPDDIPPSAPLLSRIFPTPSGIEVGWEYSATEDIRKHYLERRAVGTGTWETVLTIPKGQEDSFCDGSLGDNICFIDSSSLDLRPYQYRLVAEGTDYQIGGSEPLTVTPAIKAVNGDVSNFKIEQEEEVGGSNFIVEEQLDNLRQQGIDQFKSSSSDNLIYHIDLKWSYDLDQNVQEFQIYRAMTGGSLTPYRTIALATALGFDADQDVSVESNVGQVDFTWKDENLQKGMRYTYQVMTRHKDGSVSNRSAALTKKIN